MTSTLDTYNEQLKTYNEQMTLIRDKFQDPASVRYIHHFETMVNFLECCREESETWFDEELFKLLDDIVDNCPTTEDGPNLGGALIWVLDWRFDNLIMSP